MKITEKTRNLQEIEGAGKKTRKTRAGRARPTLYTQTLTPDRPPQAEITDTTISEQFPVGGGSSSSSGSGSGRSRSDSSSSNCTNSNGSSDNSNINNSKDSISTRGNSSTNLLGSTIGIIWCTLIFE